MGHDFDPGYVAEPFAGLCREYPGPDVYPPADFRVEWGPVFHRGRLDASARVLVLGQDPGAHEAFVRRILVGEAGQRVQGLLAKLGIERSYVMVNAFLYSVYGQGGGDRHARDPAIASHRHRWLDALFADSQIEAAIVFGRLGRAAFEQWLETPAGRAADPPWVHLTHPTQPEGSSHGDPAKRAEAMRRMLEQWNAGLEELAEAIRHPDVERPLRPYGEDLLDSDRAPIPEADLPAGLPPWMRSLKTWAVRKGEDPEAKRATLVVTVPRGERPWEEA